MSAGTPVTIGYTLSSNQNVWIRAYDLVGYPVRQFAFAAGASGAQNGTNLVVWDLKDSQGARIEAGVYVVIIKPANEPETRLRVLVQR